MPNTDSLTPGDFPALVPQGSHAKVAPIPINRPITVIGSRQDIVKLHLDSSTVSKAHCAIVLNDWGCYVHDLGSRTHTWVNGQEVREADLADGDLIKVGRFVFKYVAAKRVGKRRDAMPGELLVSTLTDPLPITGRLLQIGRRPGSDLQFDDTKVSNIHALVFARNDQWLVRDLGSRTGVRVGNDLVRQAEIDDGTRLKIGGATLTFRHRGHEAEADELDPSAPIALSAPPLTPAPQKGPHTGQPTGHPTGHPIEPAARAADPEPLELDDMPAEPDVLPSTDGLASLRRGWRPPQETPPAPANTTGKAPAKAPPPAAEHRPAAPVPPKPITPAHPLDDDDVADLLAGPDAPVEDIDLAELTGEAPKPDQPARAAPSPKAPVAKAPSGPVSRAEPTPQPREKPPEEQAEPVRPLDEDDVADLLAGPDAPAEEIDLADLIGEPTEPLADAPVADAPVVEASVAGVPSVAVPVVEVPIVEVPPSGAPTLESSPAEPAIADALAEADANAGLAEAAPEAPEAVAEGNAPTDAAFDADVETDSEAGVDAAFDALELDLEPLELDEAATDEAEAEAGPILDPDAPSAEAFQAPAPVDQPPATTETPAEAVTEAAAEVSPVVDETVPPAVTPAAEMPRAEMPPAAPAESTEPIAEAGSAETEAELDPLALDDLELDDIDLDLAAEAPTGPGEAAFPGDIAADAAETAEVDTADVNTAADETTPAEITADAAPADAEQPDDEPEPVAELAGVEFAFDEEAQESDDEAAVAEQPAAEAPVAERAPAPVADELPAAAPREPQAVVEAPADADEIELTLDEIELTLDDADDADNTNVASVDVVAESDLDEEGPGVLSGGLAVSAEVVSEDDALDFLNNVPADGAAATADTEDDETAAATKARTPAGAAAAEVEPVDDALVTGDPAAETVRLDPDTVADEPALTDSGATTEPAADHAVAKATDGPAADAPSNEAPTGEAPIVIALPPDPFPEPFAVPAAELPPEPEAPVQPLRPIPPAIVEPDHVEASDESDESIVGLSLESADEEEPVVIEAVHETAIALDLSAFIDRDIDDEAEWEDAPPAVEPALEATIVPAAETPQGPADGSDGSREPGAPASGEPAHELVGELQGEDLPDELPAPQGGSLRDLIPQAPPLIGGMFTPEGPMMIGGSPVVDFSAPPSPFGGGNGSASNGSGPNGATKRRPLRVGFGRRNKPSPFAAGETSTIADAVAGYSPAVASPGVSVDAFAAPSPTAEELEAVNAAPAAEVIEPGLAPVEDDAPAADAFIELAEPAPDADAALVTGLVKRESEEREIQKVAELFRPRGTLPAPFASGDSPFATLPITPPRPEEDPAHAAAVRRKRYKWMKALLLATFVVVPAGVWATSQVTFLKPYSTLDALITYDGLDRLGIEDARNFRSQQNTNLLSEQIRQNAIGALPTSVMLGFLGDPKQIEQAINRDPAVQWPAEQPNVMRLRMRSFDKAADLARLRALAQTLVATSATDQTQLDSLRKLVKNNTETLESLNRRLADVNSVLQDLQQAGNSRPDLQQIARLQADRKKAEDELTNVKGARQELEAALQVLQRPGSVALPAAQEIDPSRSDAAVAALTQQLAELQKQSEADKREAAARSAEARKTLDDTIAQFQKDLQGAQQLKQSPELAAYVDAANRIFIQTRELTEDLIRRQENQRTRLSELRARLMEKIDAASKDRMAKDEELKKLRDELAIDTRQYNAAIAEGDVVDAKKLELTMALVRSRIGGREDLAKSDPVYSEITEALQKTIDETERSIVDDRKHIDETLTKVQAEFSRSAPAVEKMPDEQKALAESIDKKLAAVNGARKAYDSAADKAQAEQTRIEQEGKAKAAALQLEIAARRQEVADAAALKASHDTEAARQAKIAQTQDQLAQVRLQEQKCQQQLDAANAAIDQAEKQRKAFVDSDLLRNTKQEEKAALEHDRNNVNAELTARQAELNRLIVPDRKVEFVSDDQPDRRPIYAAGVGGGLFVLMMLPVLYLLMLTSRDAHHGHPLPPPTTPAAPPSEGFEPVLVEEVEPLELANDEK